MAYNKEKLRPFCVHAALPLTQTMSLRVEVVVLRAGVGRKHPQPRTSEDRWMSSGQRHPLLGASVSGASRCLLVSWTLCSSQLCGSFRGVGGDSWLSGSYPRKAGCCSQSKCSGPACCFCSNTCCCLLTCSLLFLSALLPQDADTDKGSQKRLCSHGSTQGPQEGQGDSRRKVF